MSKTLPISQLDGTPIIIALVKPSGLKNVRRLIPLKNPYYIVVHNTGNTSRGADAQSHARYIQNVENADVEYKSWHFSVDHKQIVQHLPLDEPGWHAGDGQGVGNNNGIGIEICEDGTPEEYRKAEENAIKLIIYLQKLKQVPTSRVLPHRYFATNRKLCPRRILKSEATWKSDWQRFQSRIDATQQYIQTPTTKPQVQTPKLFKVGDIVQVKPTAKYWKTGKTIPSFVYKEKYAVKQVYSDYLVLDKIISPIYLEDVLLVEGVSTTQPKKLEVGAKVKIKTSATKYATGETIKSFVTNKTYTVQQVKSDRVLIQEIKSWVYIKDIDY